MISKGKKIKIAILLIIVATLMFSTIWIMRAKATEDSEDTFQGSYTIEYLIENYNLVTRNNVAEMSDVIGPILVGGNIESTLYHSKITNNISSYVKGKILNGGNITPNDGYTPTFYVGTVNDVKDNEINGFSSYLVDGNGQKIVETDTYIDFDLLYNNISAQSRNLAEGTIVKPDDNGKIEIKVGETVTIESLDEVSKINIVGDMNSSNLTLINIKQSGNVNLPVIEINGANAITSGSSSAGTAIVWNLPNASKVKNLNHPLVGHLIAPNADFESNDTNYAGCFIVKSLTGRIEGHYYPYNAGTLPNEETTEPDEDEKDENNTIDPDDKNETTDNNTIDPDDKNETTDNNTIDSDNRNNTTEPENETEDPVDRNNTENDVEDPVDRNTSKNNTTNKVDNTISKTKLPQTGSELDEGIIRIGILVALAIIFGIKYVKHNNKFDANK